MINSLDKDKLKKKYKKAKPFYHIVIDNFVPDYLLYEVINEFPKPDDDIFTWKSDDKNSIKLMCQDSELIGKLKYTRNLFNYLNDDRFLKQLEEITGIDELVADKELSGGGLHSTRRGGFLKVHSDFNVADNLPNLNRRLNLILFLNPIWQKKWGGYLDLYNEDLSEVIKSVKPIYNRAVIFATQPESDEFGPSWHGFPKPIECPEDVCRNSLALYYYTKEKKAKKHKTIYKELK